MFQCLDLDECAENTTNNCAAEGTCMNTPLGSYTCVCETGYVGRFCDTGAFVCLPGRAGVFLMPFLIGSYAMELGH